MSDGGYRGASSSSNVGGSDETPWQKQVRFLVTLANVVRETAREQVPTQGNDNFSVNVHAQTVAGFTTDYIQWVIRKLDPCGEIFVDPPPDCFVHLIGKIASDQDVVGGMHIIGDGHAALSFHDWENDMSDSDYWVFCQGMLNPAPRPMRASTGGSLFSDRYY